MNPPEIPDHTLLRPIGKGAYGEVWLARNVMGALRAVKIIWRQQFDSDRPFLREFDGIQRFEPVSRSADGLVHVLHVGRKDAEGYFYYVMELADDAVAADVRRLTPDGPSENESEPPHVGCYEPRTLRSDLKRHGRLPTADCIRLAIEVAGGLVRLHAQGLVHRDVKPGNIIFVEGRAKLADIGLVSTSEERRTFVGTEGYVPPEGPGSPAADIYALGLAIYEASTGLPLERFPDVPPEWFTAPGGDAALELHQVLLKASEGRRELRYQNAKELQADLLLLHTGQSVRRVHAREHRMRWVRRASLAVAAVALIAVAGLFFTDRQARVTEEKDPEGAALRSRAKARKAARQKLQETFRGADFGSNTIALNHDTTVNVPAGESLDVTNSIAGPGTLTKVGAGQLIMSGSAANTYTNTTWLKEGELLLDKGRPRRNQTIVGPLVIGDDIGGANADIVYVNRWSQIDNKASVTINSSGLLVIPDGKDDTFAFLTGNGNIRLEEGSTLEVGHYGGSSTFSGVISGDGEFRKLLTSTLILNGNNTYIGKILVTGDPGWGDGTLLVNGSQPQIPVVVKNAGTLGGSGTVGNITVAAGGILSPGASGDTLTCSNVTFQSGAHFMVKLNEAAPGASHSRLNVRGTVTLDNAILDVTPGLASAVNRAFTIIDNDGTDAVVGALDGLPQDATFRIGDVQFRVSYTGGTGNDVVLTRLPPRPP